MSLPPCVMIMGPTASGKTGLAIELVKQFPMDIISVDSALVYRGMDIGTAKPDAEELSQAPHRLIDIREPWETYSAAEFREDALEEMQSITASGRVPLLVGGTMLYFRALLDGLSELPSADAQVREKLEDQAAEVGWAAMHERLQSIDPKAAARINPNDPQRIQRALEVYEISGQSLSALQAASEKTGLPFLSLKIVVCPEQRAVLHERIELRFDQMMEQGFLDEVKALRQDPRLHEDLPSMRSVGYRQAWGFLENRYNADEMRAKAVAATRQLAKRQLTWLRREKDAMWYDLAQDKAPWGVLGAVREHLEAR